MKKLFSVVLVLLLGTTAFGQMTVLWEKTAINTTMPGWFDNGSLTRGLAYGKVEGQDYLYVVTRNGGNFVYKIDVATGDTITHLNTTGMAGGAYTLNDAGVSADGILYVANLCLGSGTDTLFKVYKWTADTLAPTLVINYINKGIRLGDKMTVTGSAADNSLIIWAASSTAGQKKVLKFTTADNGATFTPVIVNLDMGTVDVAGSSSVGPLSDGGFYWNAGGRSAMKFNADGTLVGTIPGSVVATGSSAIRYFGTFNGCEYFITHQYGAGNENARIVKVPIGNPALAETYAITPSQRLNANANGTGDVDFKDNGDGTFTMYVLSTNNGYGAYVIDPLYLAGDYYVGNPGTAPGGRNPNFRNLRLAYEALNVGKIAGDTRILFTSDVLDTASTATGFLGLAVNPGEYTITFKPYTGVQPVVSIHYPSDATTGPSGANIIGIPDLKTTDHRIAWGDWKETRNIIFDGSNTVGGTTRDLTIQSTTNSHRNGLPMVIVADVHDVVVKNMNIYHKAEATSTSGNMFVAAVHIRTSLTTQTGGTEYPPHDLTFDNCHISSNFTTSNPQNAAGMTFYSSTPDPAGSWAYNIKVKNSKIEGKRYGIVLLIVYSIDIENNEIIVNQDVASALNSYGIYGYKVQGSYYSNVNITRNRFSKISTKNEDAATRTGAINIETNGSWSIWNNMITGFEVTGTNPSGSLFAFRNNSATAGVTFYHNTVVMNELPDIGAGALSYMGIVHGNGINNINNNIFVNHEDDFKSYLLNFATLPISGGLVSDGNNWFNIDTVNCMFSNWGGDNKTWDVWRETGNDVHSVWKDVNFVSASDLHLAGASIGDNDLGCWTIGVPADIDGDARDQYAYMGADEGSVKLSPKEITVSFLANTAGVPDTLWETSTVQMRGNWPFTWGSDSPVFMYPIGGDYWRADVAIPYDSLNRVFEYKFCTFPVPPGELTGEMNGWEAGANRTLDLRTFAGADTVLPLQYVRGWKGDAGQFETPFALTDSIDVFLRVNMEALIKSQAFNPETEVVGVRGSNAWDTWAGTPDFNWGSTHVFVPENIHANGIWGSTYNGTYFYNGVLHLPRDWAGREIQYKFIIGDDWGRSDNNNRSFILPGDTSDVTVHWVWFNDVPPAGFTGNDTSDVTFFADMTKALNNNGFEIGDTLLVRYGYFGSSVQVETATMVRQTGSERYFVTVEDVPLAFGKPFYYQYYMIKGGLEQREVYFNFDYEGSVPSEAERRAFVVTTGTTVIADILDSETEARRMPVFRNNQKLAQAITVTVECDLRPAIYQVKAGSTLVDIQAGMTITPEMLTAAPDTIAQLGLFINGPMSNNAEGTWVTWGGTLAGDANRQMWDDGTHGDAVAGDSVYTIVYAFDPALGHRVGQEFKFGIGGGDNESGYGLNHIENLDDSQPTSVMYNQWGSINPKFYDAWDYDNPKPRVAVKENIPLVTKYALDQNYPNPFNPTTQIRFAVPEECDVQLVIYNALGQLVNKVTYRNLAMGVYSYFWDGTDLRGSHVASGVYFYELRAGEKFRDLKKMVLIK